MFETLTDRSRDCCTAFNSIVVVVTAGGYFKRTLFCVKYVASSQVIFLIGFFFSDSVIIL